jgi:hypothetical protein
VTLACEFRWLNPDVFERVAVVLASEMDISGIAACPLCLLELAWKIRDGERPSAGLVSRTADWVWLESEEDVRRAVLLARMQEMPYAEDALRDLEVNGWRGKFFQALVYRLAAAIADEQTG